MRLAWAGELLRDDLQAGRDRTAHATILDVLAGSSRAAEARHRCSIRSATPNVRSERRATNCSHARFIRNAVANEAGDAVVVRGEDRID